MQKIIIILIVLIVIGGVVLLFWPKKVNHQSVINLNMEKVTFKTSDGVEIIGNFYPAAIGGNQAVLLLHQFDKNKTMWGDFPEMLAQAGFAVLAIDLRGHGESGGSRDDLASAANDVAAAKEFLAGKNQTKISVIGSSIGANLALLSTGGNTRVVALSPGLDFKGIAVPLTGLPISQALVIASTDDAYSFASGKKIAESYPGVKLQTETDLGHGVAMLNVKPELKQDIINFLKFGPAGMGDEPTVKP
jgi:fermentation-respiration switch protein FrsA (DUF1100 family)